MRTTRLILAAAATAAAFASLPAANADHRCVQPPLPRMRPICTPHCYMEPDGTIRCYE